MLVRAARLLQTSSGALIAESRVLMEKKDYKEAALRLHKVIGPHPSNLEASVLYAEIGDRAGAREAVGLWRRVCDLPQGSSFDHLCAWATAALRFHDAPQAKKAVALMTPADKGDARYHEIAGKIAMESGARAEAEREFSEAIRLNPTEDKYVFDRAQLGLQSRDPVERDAARRDLKKVSTNAELRLPVLRVLATDSAVRGLRDEGLALAEKLASDKEAEFDDRLYYLSVLRAAGNAKFTPYLAQLESEAGTDAQKTGSLLAWTNKQGLALVANDWMKGLATEVASQPPAAVEIADAYLLLLDWKSLKKFTTGPLDWGNAEFQRLAFQARALRELGEESASVEQWSMSVKLAEIQPARLLTLERKAQSWGWRKETNDLLWLIAGTSEDPRAALNTLARNYAASKDTRQLCKVWQRISGLNPDDPVAKGNWALLSLLLGIDLDSAADAAEELSSHHPSDPRIALTYAYALYLHGHTEEGLQAMRALPPQELLEPAVAAYYGFLLAAEGNADAGKFLELAKTASLLPEEEKLVLEAGRPALDGMPASPHFNHLFHRPAVCDRFTSEDVFPHSKHESRDDSRQNMVQMLDLLQKIH